MRIATGDLEADGLLDTATKVWCGVFKEQDGTVRKFRPHQIKEMLDKLDCTFFVMLFRPTNKFYAVN